MITDNPIQMPGLRPLSTGSMTRNAVFCGVPVQMESRSEISIGA